MTFNTDIYEKKNDKFKGNGLNWNGSLQPFVTPFNHTYTLHTALFPVAIPPVTATKNIIESRNVTYFPLKPDRNYYFDWKNFGEYFYFNLKCCDVFIRIEWTNFG